MISFRDMTFCMSKNCKNECGRKLTQEVIDAAYEWWGGEDAPIAMARFCDKDGKLINNP